MRNQEKENDSDKDKCNELESVSENAYITDRYPANKPPDPDELAPAVPSIESSSHRNFDLQREKEALEKKYIQQ